MAHDPTSVDESPATTLLLMMRGYWVSQAIFVAARLNIADLLRDGPKSCSALAVSTGVLARSLFRLMRALASVGVFTREGADTFAMTPLAEPLRSDFPGSLRASGVFMGEVLYGVWGELLPGLQSEQLQFERVFGGSFWEHLGRYPDTGEAFQDMMADLNTLTSTDVAEIYDFSGIRSVVDIGGGTGSQLATLLLANPHLNGVLFDLPYALGQARQYLTNASVIDRCELKGGDFFDHVPAGGDVYLLRWILHDYDDERCLMILRHCRAVMPPDGRLLVVELVVPEEADPAAWASMFLDLQMLLIFGGQERTEAEFQTLFAAAGFHLQRTVRTRSHMSLLEGIPIEASVG